MPFPSPEDLPDPGIEPRSPTLQRDTLTSEPPGKPRVGLKSNNKCSYKGKNRRRYSHRGEGHVTMEAKTGFIQPQAKELLEPLEVLEARKDSPSESLEGVLLC